jgi:hypothetical protein
MTVSPSVTGVEDAALLGFETIVAGTRRFVFGRPGLSIEADCEEFLALNGSQIFSQSEHRR